MAKTQWHPAFCAAMRLELKGIPSLQFTDEYNLTEKPLEIDLLVIKKPPDTRINHMIGEFFGEHNLLEYKSPTDRDFNEFAIFQVLSYAYYYGDKYRTRDITVSLVVSKAHFDLLRWFDAHGVRYIKRHNGIYTVHGLKFLRVQVVVTEELDEENVKWLSVLTDKLAETRAKKFVAAAYGLNEYEEKRLAEAVTQVVTSANGRIFEKLKEEKDMASALMELMRPEVEEYAQNYANERVRESEMEHVKTMIRYGADNDYIKLIINVTDEEIEKLREQIKKE